MCNFFFKEVETVSKLGLSSLGSPTQPLHAHTLMVLPSYENQDVLDTVCLPEEMV